MHLRQRFLTEIIDKKRKIFPLVGVLGARQVGKSTLLRDIIGKQNGGIRYLTLDRPEILKEARVRAENFVLSNTNEFTSPITIDEAHKAPGLFDILKVLADEKRKRGIVTITGSVDFALASGVRETLTGRIGICRLYPLTIAELTGKPFRTRWAAANKKSSGKKQTEASATDTQVEAWLERGGMPSICRLHDRTERESMIEEWLQSVCYRDLLQLRGAKYDGALAREIIQHVAERPDLSQAELAHAIGEDSRVVAKHILGLEALFILTKVRPYKQKGGGGFDRYYVLDASVASYLRASRKTLYTILMINEILAQHEYGGIGRVELFYYATRRSTKIDLLVSSGRRTSALVISDRATIDPYSLRTLRTLRDKGFSDSFSIVSPVAQEFKIDRAIIAVPIRYYC